MQCIISYCSIFRTIGLIIIGVPMVLSMSNYFKTGPVVFKVENHMTYLGYFIHVINMTERVRKYFIIFLVHVLH